MIEIEPGVQDALHKGRPVVALETAVLTHGLPAPLNLEAIAAMHMAVETAGALPALVAVVKGVLRIGIGPAHVLGLVSARGVRKLAARDLAPAMVGSCDGGTTVSATLVACRLAGIRILATGGIGGVHRGWQSQPDVSEDLRELARSRVCVVSSGAKSVLDIAATLEVLETLGIPTLGWRTHQFPVFYTAGTLPVSQRADDLQFVTRVLRTRWNLLDQGGGVLLANPVPAADALSAAELERIVDEAIAEARPRGIFGSALTPFLLDRVAHKTGGRSVQANLALLKSNATLAAQLAVQWSSEGATDDNNKLRSP